MNIVDKIINFINESDDQKHVFDHRDIEKETMENDNYRKILFTTDIMQLGLMSIEPNDETGMEVHEKVDQFIRFESGNGKMIIGDREVEVKDGTSVIVVNGNRHNIINTSKDKPLKLYTIYSPPEHRDGIVYRTKKEEEIEERKMNEPS